MALVTHFADNRPFLQGLLAGLGLQETPEIVRHNDLAYPFMVRVRQDDTQNNERRYYGDGKLEKAVVDADGCL